MAAARQPPSFVSVPAGGVSMKEYLKWYQSGAADEKKAKKKTKKKPKPATMGGGVIIIDEDPVW
jgi:pre-mRNA-splicing factor CWC26